MPHGKNKLHSKQGLESLENNSLFGDWGNYRNLKCFSESLRQSLSWSHCEAGRPSTHLQSSYWRKEFFAQRLKIFGLTHPLLKLGWCSWDDTHLLFSSKHSEWSLYIKFVFWSHPITWNAPMSLLDHPDVHRQMSDWPGLSRGTFQALQYFYPMTT